jgi:hypothetical protein
MNERILPGHLLRLVDPIYLYPGIRVYDKDSRREGEIIKIESNGRGLPEVLVVFDNSDSPVDAVNYPNMVVLED